MLNTANKAVASAAQVTPTLTRKGGETRKVLLESTITLLASRGYGATSTQAVLDHAGISRGSLLHQFKTRDQLMVAAALEAVERMFLGVQQGLANSSDPIEALREYPDVLWKVQNQMPARAFAELQLASRWEQSLQTALRPAVDEINNRIVREINESVKANGLKNVKALVVEVAALISATQGLAVSDSLRTDSHKSDEILAVLKSHYLDCLESSITAE